MNILECDRCGERCDYLGDVFTFPFLKGAGVVSWYAKKEEGRLGDITKKEADLCKECYKQFKTFIKG